MKSTDPSPIVGVFRDHAKANHAIEALKQAGFRENRIKSAVSKFANSIRGANTREYSYYCNSQG